MRRNIRRRSRLYGHSRVRGITLIIHNVELNIDMRHVHCSLARLPTSTTNPIVQFVANGAFCAVFTCKYQGYSVVAKRVRQDLPLSDRQDALDNLWTEHDCLRRLCHPNVIDVYGMWWVGRSGLMGDSRSNLPAHSIEMTSLWAVRYARLRKRKGG